MIHITYSRSRHRLTVVGHAGAAPLGKDLVCAAVSALTLTLASNVASLATGEQATHPVLRLQEGDAWISCVAAPGKGAVVTMIFDTVCAGFELLQTLYPENIQYHVQG